MGAKEPPSPLHTHLSGKQHKDVPDAAPSAASSIRQPRGQLTHCIAGWELPEARPRPRRAPTAPRPEAAQQQGGGEEAAEGALRTRGLLCVLVGQLIRALLARLRLDAAARQPRGERTDGVINFRAARRRVGGHPARVVVPPEEEREPTGLVEEEEEHGGCADLYHTQ